MFARWFSEGSRLFIPEASEYFLVGPTRFFHWKVDPAPLRERFTIGFNGFFVVTEPPEGERSSEAHEEFAPYKTLFEVCFFESGGSRSSFAQRAAKQSKSLLICCRFLLSLSEIN